MPRTAKPKVDPEAKDQEPETTEDQDPGDLDNDGRPDESFEPVDPDPSTYVTDTSVGTDSTEVSATPAEDLNTQQDVNSGFQPDNVNTSVAGGYAQSTQNNLSDVRYTQPVNNLKPVTDAVNNANQADLSAVLNALSPEALVTILNAVSAAKGVKLNATATEVEAAKEVFDSQLAHAPKAKKPEIAVTFRNDLHKNIQIQELDMSQESPSRFPLPGKYIQFSGGVFVATTENQVKQLEWMSKTDSIAKGGSYGNYTVGGNRDIYRPEQRVSINLEKLKDAGLTDEQIAKLS